MMTYLIQNFSSRTFHDQSRSILTAVSRRRRSKHDLVITLREIGGELRRENAEINGVAKIRRYDLLWW
jgi:CRISPR/Cas system endoribonuclease Cas6 (RAMP superfamily)